MLIATPGIRTHVAAAFLGLAMSACLAIPAHAQLTDSQVCVNPTLKDPITKGVQAMKTADVQADDSSGLGKLVKSGARMKALTNDTLVSRTKDEIVCRYDAVWGSAGAADTTVKFIIKVTSGPNGSADVDAYVE